MKKGKPGFTLHVLGVMALVLAPSLWLYAWFSQENLSAFRQSGTVTMARVTGKSRSKALVTHFVKKPTDYRVRVSFWTASLLKGGRLVVAEIRDFVRPAAWKELDQGDRVEIVFLPGHPEKAILKSSLESAWFASAERYEFALAVLLLGITLLWVAKRTKAKHLLQERIDR